MQTPRRNNHNQWFLVLVGAIALVLAACGGGSSNAGASGTASTSTTTPGRGFQNAAFQTCLKDHGVTLRPRSGGSRPGAGGPGRGGLTAKQQSAFSACRSKLPNGGRNGFGGFGGANPAALQAYLSCLSDHGVTVPTTTSGSTPSSSSPSGSGPSGSVLNTVRRDPKFAAANQTCRALLPTRGGTTSTTNGT